MTAERRLMKAAAFVVLLSGSLWAQSPRDRILGSWRGTSLCTNREALPACADEQVVYDITPAPATPDAVIVKADKIVDGRRVPMGETTFRLDATGRWVSEIETPRAHVLWYLSIRDDTASGGMTLLPSKTQVRAIELRRAQGSV